MGFWTFIALFCFTANVMAKDALHVVVDLDHTLWIPLDQTSIDQETLDKDRIFEEGGRKVVLIPGAIELLQFLRNGLNAELSVQTFGSSVFAGAILKKIPFDESHSLFELFQGQITRLRHDPMDPHRSEFKNFEAAPANRTQEIFAIDDSVDAWSASDRHNVLEVPRDKSVLDGSSHKRIRTALSDGNELMAGRILAAQNRLIFIAGMIALAEVKSENENISISEALFEIRFKKGSLSEHLKTNWPSDLIMHDNVYKDIGIYRLGLAVLNRYSPKSKVRLNTLLGRMPKERIAKEIRSFRKN